MFPSGFDIDFLRGLAEALGPGEPDTDPPLEDLPNPPAEIPEEPAKKPAPGPESAPEEASPEPTPPPAEKPAPAEEADSGGSGGVPMDEQDIIQLTERVANEEGVDPHLLISLMRVESSLNPDAESPKGAKGLFQLTPAAISDVGMDPAEVMGNPELEAQAAARYLKKLRDEYGASTVEEQVAAYNAGPSVIGKPEDQWPEETRNHVRKFLGLYGPGAEGSAEKPAPEADRIAAAAEEPTGGQDEEPAETPVDENGEPLVTDPAGNPVPRADGRPLTQREVEESPLGAAEAVTGQQAQMSPEERLTLDEALKKQEMSPLQRFGIAILAINNPRAAMALIAQHEAGRTSLIRQAMAGQQQAQQANRLLAREQAIGKRMEEQEKDRLFRSQVTAYSRQRQALIEQMVKDGIPIDKDRLPPATIQTPEDLDRAQAQLQELVDEYAARKSAEKEKEKKAKAITKATDLTRKGGVGSETLKSQYPDWKKDPQLRDLIPKLEEQEEANRRMAEAERERLNQQAASAQATAERNRADVERLRSMMNTDRARAATGARDAMGRIAGQIRQIDEQITLLQALMQNTWLPWKKSAYAETMAQLQATRDQLQDQLDELDVIAQQAAAGETPGEGGKPISQEEAYRRLQGQMEVLRGAQLPNAPEGVTLQWFVNNALKTGSVQNIARYGPDAARLVFQEAFKITGNVALARELTEKWIRDVTTGGPWYMRPLPGVVGEAGAEQQMMEMANEAASAAAQERGQQP